MSDGKISRLSLRRMLAGILWVPALIVAAAILLIGGFIVIGGLAMGLLAAVSNSPERQPPIIAQVTTEDHPAVGG
ncbi:MAG TPA: hypothetical protein VNF29_02440 [Candidatus Binataceae bacterium]|nr:hypothetical protein [Candidatus Binataceae bacterium]